MSDRKFPENHPMRQVWLDNKKLRTMDGLIEYARDGDLPALTTILGIFVGKIRNQRPIPPEVLQFLREVFLNWFDGQSFDESFYQKKSIGRQRPDSKKRHQYAVIAWEVETRKDGNPELSYDDICLAVADEYGIGGEDSGDAVNKIRQKYAGPPARRNK